MFAAMLMKADIGKKRRQSFCVHRTRADVDITESGETSERRFDVIEEEPIAKQSAECAVRSVLWLWCSARLRDCVTNIKWRVDAINALVTDARRG